MVATNEYGTACKYVEVGLHEYTGTFWWPLVKCTTGKMSVETQKPSRCDDASAGNSQDLVINSQKLPKIGPQSAGNSQDYKALDVGAPLLRILGNV